MIQNFLESKKYNILRLVIHIISFSLYILFVSYYYKYFYFLDIYLIPIILYIANNIIAKKKDGFSHRIVNCIVYILFDIQMLSILLNENIKLFFINIDKLLFPTLYQKPINEYIYYYTFLFYLFTNMIIKNKVIVLILTVIFAFFILAN